MQYHRIMCLDYGDARIGIAFSDLLGLTATPYQVYKTKGTELDIEYLSQLAKKNDANLVVIGMPYSLDGSENERTAITKSFGQKLGEVSNLKVIYEDERLSSYEAEQLLRERKVPPMQRKQYLDMLSAAVILESYLKNNKGEWKMEEKKELGIMDILLDEDNEDPITLYDENDKAVRFDQVAIIPLDNKLYAILKPIDPMEGVADDEAIVFYVNEDGDGDATLEIETDEPTAIMVFDEYYKLLDKAENKQ